MESRHWSTMLNSNCTTIKRCGLYSILCRHILSHFAILREKTSALSPINWRFLEGLEVPLLVAVLASSLLAFFIYIFENVPCIFRIKPGVSSGEIMSYVSGWHFHVTKEGITLIGYVIAMTIIMTSYTANLTATSIMASDKSLIFKAYQIHRYVTLLILVVNFFVINCWV